LCTARAFAVFHAATFPASSKAATSALANGIPFQNAFVPDFGFSSVQLGLLSVTLTAGGLTRRPLSSEAPRLTPQNAFAGGHLCGPASTQTKPPAPSSTLRCGRRV